MNYHQQERQNLLAVSYVLGSMKGKARLRFQSLLMQHAELRQLVWYWEQSLNPIVEKIKPVAPDKVVWHKISERLGWQQLPKKRFRYLTELTMLATAACLGLMFLIPNGLLQFASTEQIAVLQNSQSEALWVVQFEDGAIKTHATNAVKIVTEGDYELWILPADGSAPISLGLLPQQNERQLQLPSKLSSVKIAALAVNLEPKGGSPTGQPTQPVLHTAQLVKL